MTEYEKNQIAAVKQNTHIENELSKVMNEQMKRAKDALRPYIGRKAVKISTGELIKKIKLEFPRKVECEPLRSGEYADASCILLRASYSTIWIYAKVCFSGGSYDDHSQYCIYKEDQRYIADYDKANGTLEAVGDDYEIGLRDPETEAELFITAQQAKKAFQVANEKLLPSNRIK